MELSAVVWAMTHYKNYLFGAPFKIVTDHKALLSCLSEGINTKTTKTTQNNRQELGFGGIFVWPPVGLAPKQSKLDNSFVVAQINSINRLFQPAAKLNTVANVPFNDVIKNRKSERELLHWTEIAAKKQLINSFQNIHLFKVCTAGHKRTDYCKKCSRLNPLKMNTVVEPNDGQETRKLTFINDHGTISSKQQSADTFVIPPEMFPATLFE